MTHTIQQSLRARTRALLEGVKARQDMQAACLWRTTFTEECSHYDQARNIPIWTLHNAREAWCLENCRGRFYSRSLDREENTIEWEFGFEDVTDLADFHLAMECGL